MEPRTEQHPSLQELIELSDATAEHLKTCARCRVERRLYLRFGEREKQAVDEAHTFDAASMDWEQSSEEPSESLDRYIHSLDQTADSLLPDTSQGPEVSPRTDDATPTGVEGLRYHDRGVLGRGGMGEVLRVHDPVLKRDIALKVAHPTMLRGPRRALDRFVEEAQVQAQLNHPNLVPIHELGVLDDGRPYFTMEIVHGRSLHQIIHELHAASDHRWGQTDEGLTLRRLIALFGQACRAMGYAHERGVIHRDLKPANLMLGGRGELRVVDWGLAKVLGRRAPQETSEGEQPVQLDPARPATQMGRVAGTPYYMPPEQAGGRIDQLDVQSDVYSLGAVLYTILAGHAPYTDTGVSTVTDLLRHVRAGPPTSLHELSTRPIPDELIDVVERAMHRDKTQRYADGYDLAQAVEDWLDVETPLQRLDRLAGEWEAGNLNLLSGDQLATARALQKEHIEHKLPDRVLALIAQSNAAEEELAAREREEFEHQQRLTRIASIVAGVALAAMVMAIWGWNTANKATAASVRSTYQAGYYAATGLLEQARLGDSPTVEEAQHSWIYALSSLKQPVNARRQAEVKSMALARLSVVRDNLTSNWVSPRSPGPMYAQATGVAFSPDGASLVSSTLTGTLHVWDVQTHQKVTTLQGHARDVWALAVSPDGKTVASGGADHTLRLWDMDTGALHKRIDVSDQTITSVAFSPDGQTVAAATDHTIQFWDAETGAPQATLTGHMQPVTAIVFSPDGHTLFSASRDRTMRKWDVRTGRTAQVLSGHTDEPLTLAYAPDGKTLASGSADWSIRLWDPATGRLRNTLSGHTGHVLSLAFSSDSHTLVSASDDETMQRWNVETGAALGPPIAHESSVRSVAFSSDARTLASATLTRGVQLWDAETGTEHRGFAGHSNEVTSVAFSPDGRMLASASWDGTVRLWNPATGTEYRALHGHTGVIWTLAFSPDGQTLVTGSDDLTIRWWNPQTGAQLAVLEGHEHAVVGLAFSPDGTKLASSSKGKTVRLWDTETRAELRTFDIGANNVWGLVFSPDGQTLATGDWNRNIKLWNVDTGAIQHEIKAKNAIWSLDFSPRGRWLATGSWEGTVEVWNVATQERWYLIEHGHQVRHVAFSPDGRTLASGSRDGSLRLWNIHNGELIDELYGHDGVVWTLAFSPDGRTLASGSVDTTIRLWSLPEFSPPILTQQRREMRDLAFSPDGMLYFTNTKGELHQWAPESRTEIGIVGEHGDDVYGLDVSGDGRTAVTWSSSTTALWDLEERKLKDTFSGIRARLSPDGERLAVVVDDTKPVHLIDLQTRTVVQRLEAPDGTQELAFSADGKVLASASATGEVYVWQTETGALLALLKGGEFSVLTLAFSPDGQTLAAGAADHTIRLWDLPTRTTRAVLRRHKGPIRSVAFSPDGRTLASASEDLNVYLWDVASGAHLTAYMGHEGWVKDVAFSPDGRLVASTSADHSVRLWPAFTLHDGLRDLLASSDDPENTPLLDALIDCSYRAFSFERTWDGLKIKERPRPSVRSGAPLPWDRRPLPRGVSPVDWLLANARIAVDDPEHCRADP